MFCSFLKRIKMMCRSVTLDIVVHSLPVPSFTYETQCVGQPISFQNTTTASSSLEHIQWEINGLIDTSYHTVRTFLQEGLFPISLYVEDEWGCSNTYSEMLEIHPNPESDFYFSPSDPSTTDPLVQFINLSTPNTQASWDLVTFSTIWSPVHAYGNAGWQDVQLEIEDDNGCQDLFKNLYLLKVTYCFMFQMLSHQMAMEITICLVQRVLKWINGNLIT